MKLLNCVFAILFALSCFFNTACSKSTDETSYTDEISVSENNNISIIQPDDNSENLYCTKTGKCYHRSDCPYLKSKIPISLDDALKSGLRACLRCDPPCD